jgi:Ni/Co efflux regulator RcnB
MRKSLLALMLASVTITPAMAKPDRPDRQELTAEEPQFAQQTQQRTQAVPEPAQRIERVTSLPAQERIFVGQQDGARGERDASNRGGGDRGGGNRGGGGFPQQQQQQQQPPSPVAQSFPSRQSAEFDGRGRGRGSVDSNQNPVFAQQPQGQVFGRQGGDRDFNRNRGGDVGQRDEGRHWTRNSDGRWGAGHQGHDDNDHGDHNRDYRNDQRYGRSNGGFGLNFNFGRDRQSQWNRNWRGESRYNWQDYRNDYSQYFRAPRYYNPYGYGNRYQRFGIGVYLSSGFYGRNYWINEPYSYRLPEAPYGYQWVRYYDDVLLVDIRSGYVVDVIYSFFW